MCRVGPTRSWELEKLANGDAPGTNGVKKEAKVEDQDMTMDEAP